MTEGQKTTTANSGLAKGGVSCVVETFVVYQTFLLRMNICGKNPALRQAANRYMKCLADRFQLKIREGKTKRKKPTHF